MKTCQEIRSFYNRVARTAVLPIAVGLITVLIVPVNAVPAGYTQSWSDEFTSINSATWGYDTGAGGWGNNELQTYTTAAANAQIVSGALRIEAIKSGSSYSSARLKTQGKHTFQYGYVEARCQTPGGNAQGIWPAWWMLGQNIGSVSWPQCGEIDICEQVNGNGTNYGTLHGPSNYNGGGTIGVSLNTYHTYGVLWTSTAITFYQDGNAYNTQTQGGAGGGWVFTQPFFYLANMAVGGSFPGNPNSSTTFPKDFSIDYIREYKSTGGTTGGTTGTTTTGGVTLTAGVHTLTPQCATGSRLDDSAGGTANGNKIQIWTANGSQPQNWNFASAGTNVWTAAVNIGPYCLDAGSGAVSAKVQLWSCNGTATQKWTSAATGTNYQFKNGINGNCLDVSGAGTADGTQVLNYTCNGTNAQLWAVH